MELSVIIPVYNVVKWLERCVLSVVAQGLADYEIILVDDGSTDGSGELCDELCQQYASIRVIHQPNGGLSAARNAGIAVARGQYITFVDSDDELCPNTLRENLNFLLRYPEVDMLEYPIEVHAGSAEAYLLTFRDEILADDVFVDWVRRSGYKHCYACNKIYRAEIWEKVRFSVGRYFEDGDVMPVIVKLCRCLYYSSVGCYRYVLHSDSITTRHGYVKQRHLFDNNYRLFLSVKDVAALHSESLELWFCCLNQLVDMGRCVDVDKDDYHQVIADVCRYSPPSAKLFREALKKRLFKFLLLPVIGLRNYLRCYVALTSRL